MNLTWHIVKKDFRRFLLPLALWVGLMAGQMIFSYLIFRAADEDVDLLQLSIRGLDALHEVLWVMQLVLGFFLVAGLIHEDSLVGQQTWWVTRPITGARLLAAKLISLFLFILALPALALLPWWLFCGYGANEVMWASLQIMGGQAIIYLLALALATLTANYSRFVVGFFVTLFAWFCGAFPIFRYYWSGIKGSVQLTRMQLVTIMAVVTLVLVIIHQFRTRRLGRSLGIFASGFALVLLGLAFAPWDWSERYYWGGGEPAALAEVIATPGPVEFGEKKQMPGSDESLLMMYMGTRFEGMPRGYALNGGPFLGSLRWPDGTNLQRGGWTFSYFGPVAWELMGVPVTAAKFMESQRDMSIAPSVVSNAVLPRSYAVKLREHAPAWDAQLKLHVYTGELVAEVPLKPGAKGGHSGHQIEVKGLIRHKDGNLTLWIAETEPVLDYESVPGFLTTQPRRGIPYTFYALVSRDRTKIAMVGEERLLYTMMGTVGVMQRRIEFARGVLANPTDPDWLNEAVIMKVVFHQNGTITRNVHSDALSETAKSSRWKFNLTPDPAKPAPAN